VCLLVLLVNEDMPIYVAEADESTERQWINDLPHPQNSANYSLTLIWHGRYRSDARYDDAWRKTANRWRPGNVACTSSYNCVDDSYSRSVALSGRRISLLFSVNLLDYKIHSVVGKR